MQMRVQITDFNAFYKQEMDSLFTAVVSSLTLCPHLLWNLIFYRSKHTLRDSLAHTSLSTSRLKNDRLQASLQVTTTSRKQTLRYTTLNSHLTSSSSRRITATMAPLSCFLMRTGGSTTYWITRRRLDFQTPLGAIRPICLKSTNSVSQVLPMHRS